MLVTGTIKAIEEVNWTWHDQEAAESGIWMAIPVQFGVDGVFHAATRFVITGDENLSSMRLDHLVEYATPPKLLMNLLSISKMPQQTCGHRQNKSSQSQWKPVFNSVGGFKEFRHVLLTKLLENGHEFLFVIFYILVLTYLSIL